MTNTTGRYSKQIRRWLRDWAMVAYARELTRELTQLDQNFARWRAGEIDSRELNYFVHHYETGAARELYKQYEEGSDDMNVAYAIIAGILEREEVPVEVIEALDRPLSFYESVKARGDLRLPGES
ncbi:MAG: hypothetical protein JXA33_28270 [Anaerolineae bacterium]|nr:hypothetical protein [Anaerolineae bacterium]